MDKGLKKIPAEQVQIEDNTDNANRSEQEGNDRADVSPSASTSSSSATLWIRTMMRQADLTRSEAKKQKPKLSRLFEIQIYSYCC